MQDNVILQKADPLPLAIQQQLFPELQQLLVVLRQERRVIPTDCLGAADEGRGGLESDWNLHISNI